MKEQEPYWHAAIHQVMPALEIKDLVINHEGVVNDIVIVNKEWVFRFANGEYGQEMLDLEYQLMRHVAPSVRLSIPAPIIHDIGVIVYPYLTGEIFSRKLWLQLGEKHQQKLADQLGMFLQALHSIQSDNLEWEIPHTMAPVSHETWSEIYERILIKVYPLLLPSQIKWADELFDPVINQADFFDYEPKLIHGDLAPYHILYDLGEKRISAVIDFWVAGMGDPAMDFGTLISHYGESLVKKMDSSYLGYQKIIQRARFYAQAVELQWVLMAVESGDKYWFTAHLGGARDIG